MLTKTFHIPFTSNLVLYVPPFSGGHVYHSSWETLNLGGFTSNGLDFSTEDDMNHVIVTRVMELFLFNVVGSSKRLKLKRKSLCPTVKDSLNPIFKPKG